MAYLVLMVTVVLRNFKRVSRAVSAVSQDSIWGLVMSCLNHDNKIELRMEDDIISQGEPSRG